LRKLPGPKGRRIEGAELAVCLAWAATTPGVKAKGKQLWWQQERTDGNKSGREQVFINVDDIGKSRLGERDQGERKRPAGKGGREKPKAET